MGKPKSKDKDKDKESNVNDTIDENNTLVEADKSTNESDARPDYNELVKYVSIVAKPLAPKKLTKRLYKTTKKACKSKTVCRGLKEVVKAVRKGEKGLVVIAGDVSPIDVITHIPVLCEDNNVPYIYVPSKEDLGTASLTKRPTSIVLIKNHSDISDYYNSCVTEVKSLLEETLLAQKYN